MERFQPYPDLSDQHPSTSVLFYWLKPRHQNDALMRNKVHRVALGLTGKSHHECHEQILLLALHVLDPCHH